MGTLGRGRGWACLRRSGDGGGGDAEGGGNSAMARTAAMRRRAACGGCEMTGRTSPGRTGRLAAGARADAIDAGDGEDAAMPGTVQAAARPGPRCGRAGPCHAPQCRSRSPPTGRCQMPKPGVNAQGCPEAWGLPMAAEGRRFLCAMPAVQGGGSLRLRRCLGGPAHGGRPFPSGQTGGQSCAGPSGGAGTCRGRGRRS